MNSWNVSGAFRVGCMVLATVLPARAQSSVADGRRIQGGLGMTVGVPSGDFATHVDSAGGITAQVDTSLGLNLVSVGGELSYLIYGSDGRDVPLGSLIPEAPNAKVHVSTDNQIVTLHARVRVQTPYVRWRPYTDALFGFSDFFTSTTVEGTGCSGSDCDSSSVDSETNAQDVVLSYGLGVGVTYGFTSRPHAPRLDVSVRYLRQGEADYLTEGAIRVVNGQAFFDTSHSRTDMFAIYVGVAFGR